LKSFSETHALAYLFAPQCLPIELIHYPNTPFSKENSPLQIVINETEALSKLGRKSNAYPQLPEIDGYHIDGFTSPILASPQAEIPSLVIHRVRDMESARRFWENGLGFREAKKQMVDFGGLMLEFAGIFPQWSLRLLLLPHSDSPAQPCLDGAGFRVLSMISTKFKEDIKKMFTEGGAIDSIGEMRLKINGKNLLLDLIQGPDGVFIEILKMEK